jgi:hypothetical protein
MPAPSDQTESAPPVTGGSPQQVRERRQSRRHPVADAASRQDESLSVSCAHRRACGAVASPRNPKLSNEPRRRTDHFPPRTASHQQVLAEGTRPRRGSRAQGAPGTDSRSFAADIGWVPERIRADRERSRTIDPGC